MSMRTQAQLRQPWQEYLTHIATQPEAQMGAGHQVKEDSPVEMCPGGHECSFEPHVLGSTNSCAKSTKIGVVFMNSSG